MDQRKQFVVRDVANLLNGIMIPVRNSDGFLVGEARLVLNVEMQNGIPVPVLFAYGILNNTREANMLNDMIRHGFIRTVEMVPRTWQAELNGVFPFQIGPKEGDSQDG